MTDKLNSTNDKPEPLKLEGLDSAAVQAAIKAARAPEISTDEDSLSLLHVFGKSTLHSAVQHPLEGLTQLVNRITPLELPMPHLMDAPRQEQFASKRWYASTIGQGAGFIVPFAITERCTSGLASLHKASRGVRAAETAAMTSMPARFLPPGPALAKATLDGGLSGFVFTPAMPGNGGFWEQRGVSALSSATMFGSQMGGAHVLSGGFRRMGMPMTNDLLAATSKQVALRLGVNATSGVFSGVLGAEVSSVVSGRGFADSQTLKEAALAAAVTGFALDGYHVTKAKLFDGAAKPSESGKLNPDQAQPEPTPEKASRQLASDSAKPELGSDSAFSLRPHAAENTMGVDAGQPVTAEPRRTGMELMIVPQPQPIDVLLAVPNHHAIDTFSKPGDVGDGAVKYEAADGQKFWQLADGQIYFESQVKGANNTESRTRHTFWNPYGMGKENAYVDRLNPNRDSLQVATRDDALGMFKDTEGQLIHPELANDYRDATGKSNGRDVPQATWDALTIPTRRLEPDFIASLRVLPAKNGQPYESTSIPVRVLKETAPPVEVGLPYDIFFHDYLKPELVPARKYRVLSEPQVQELAIANRLLAEGKLNETAYEAKLDRLRDEALNVVLEESYAKKLDGVRELRDVATMDVSKNPDQREQILLARRQLYLSTYGNRFLPEHMGQFADVIPNRGRIPELVLMEHARPEDAYDIAQGGYNTIADTMLSTGQVRFFKDHAGVWQHVRRTLTHEWVHTTEIPNADLVQALTQVAQMDTFSGRRYADKNASEHWAVNSAEMFLDPNPELFLTLAHRSPIKALIIAEGVSRELKVSTEGQRSVDADVIEQRIKYAQVDNLPAVQDQFMQLLGSRNTSDTARTLAMVDGLAQSREAYKLVEKLIDSRRVSELIDSAISDGTVSGDKVFDLGLETRRLLRMELLRTVDGDAFERFSTMHADVKAQIRSAVKARIASGDKAALNEAFELGNALVAEPNTQQLFQSIFDRKQLERTVYAESPQDGGAQALNLLNKGYDRADNHEFYLELLKSESPLRDDATNWLMSDTDPSIQSDIMKTLLSELESGKSTALGPKTLTGLKELVDSKLASLESRDLEPHLAVRTLKRAALLKEYSRLVPEARDSEMTARLERAERVTQRISQQMTEILTRGNQNQSSNVISSLIQLTGTQTDRAIGRSLVSQETLINAALAKQPHSPQALDMLRWLYDKTDHTDFLIRLAHSDSGLQNEALYQLAWHKNHEYLEQAIPVIESLNRQGTLEGGRILQALNSLFQIAKNYSVNQTEMTVQIRAAREILANTRNLDPKIAETTRQHLAHFEPLLNEPHRTGQF